MLTTQLVTKMHYTFVVLCVLAIAKSENRQLGKEINLLKVKQKNAQRFFLNYTGV